jgi:salicylate hydroxylase
MLHISCYQVCSLTDLLATLTIPAHGQGASSSIEDAAALEVLLEGATSEDIVDRLQLFQSLRHPRATATQAMSNYMIQGGPKMIEEARKYYTGALPPPGSKTFSQPFSDFFFQYDIFEEAKKVVTRPEMK